MFNPTTAQRVNERYRRLLINSGWVLPESGAELTLNYDFVAQPSLSSITNPSTGAPAGPTLDIARTTTKTFSDWETVLHTVLAGEAVFTGCRRVENICLQSENFATGWTTTNTVDSVDATITPPSGVTTVTKLAQTDNSGTPQFVRRQDPVYSPGQKITHSLRVRPGTITICYLLTLGRNSSDDNQEDVYFDLSTGTVGTARNGAVGTIKPLENGWFEIGMQTLSDYPNSTTVEFRLGITHADGQQLSTLAAGEFLHIAGAQVENVSGQTDPAPSEYQKTTTVPAARNYTVQTNGLPLASRTVENLILQSNDLSTTWANTRSSDSQNVGTDPFGGNTANSITENATEANTHQIQQVITLPGAGTYAWSVYIKASNRMWVGIRPHSFGSANGVSYFDVGNGVLGTVGANVDSHSIQNVGNDWYRCTVIWTETDADLAGIMQILIAPSNNTILFDGLNQESLLIYGNQLEDVTGQADPAPSEYVPTTTVAVAQKFHKALDGSDLVSTIKGLQIAETRTNLIRQSENLNTTWSNFQSVDTQDVGTAPDGTDTANKLTDDSGGGGPQSAAITQSVTVAINTVFTMSAYLKADQLGWGRLQMNALGSLQIDAYFDLINGVVGTTPDPSTTSTFIEDAGNGWFRCGLTFTSDASDTSGSFNIYVAEADNDAIVDDDGTSSILIWGAQLEAGAFLTPYIPTTTGTVTRNKDVVSTTDMSWLTPGVGTLFVDFNYPHDFVAGFPMLFTLHDGTGDNLIQRYIVGSSENTALKVRTASVTQGEPPIPNADPAQDNLASGAYATNDLIQYLNGAASAPDSSIAVPLGLTGLNVGSDGPGGSTYNGHISELRYYNLRGFNQELEDLSNGLLTPVT